MRTTRPDDARWFGYYRDPEVCRYLKTGLLDDEGIRHRLQRMVAATAPRESGDILALVVEHRNVVIGDLLLRLGPANALTGTPGIGEIGWVMDREYGGQGLATEAARALIDLSFGQYPLHRVTAHLDPDNLRSARLCERLGMRKEAHLRSQFPKDDGSWADLAIYGLQRDEWTLSRR